jgi:hypothetical protein
MVCTLCKSLWLEKSYPTFVTRQLGAIPPPDDPFHRRCLLVKLSWPSLKLPQTLASPGRRPATVCYTWSPIDRRLKGSQPQQFSMRLRAATGKAHNLNPNCRYKGLKP